MLVQIRAAGAATARQRIAIERVAIEHSATRGRRARAISAAVIGGLLLAACKTLSPDGGMDAVAAMTGDTLESDVTAIRSPEQATAARARIEALLHRPLSARGAIQIALLNNHRLQADYNALGIAEAAMVEASLPPSPTISLQRISGDVEVEIERHIVGDILALATLPARTEIAGDRFRQAQLTAAEATLRLGAQTRRAYYRAVAALETADFLEQAADAAKTASDLAKRLSESGAMNKVDQAREEVFYAETAAQSAKARALAQAERERLVRAMGLSGKDLAFKLPSALPPLPAKPRAAPAVERQALARRLDLQIARIELDTLAKSYGLTQATRFLNLLELAGASKTTIDRTSGQAIRDRGLDVEFQIPLFDFGAVRVREAEQTYMQAVNRLAALAVDARSQAREAYQRYRSSYDIAARYRNDVLPLRKVISDEMLLRYNAMMVDVFGLLTEARQRVASRMSGVEAERDFWLASVDLDAAIQGGGVTTATEESPSMASAPLGTDGE